MQYTLYAEPTRGDVIREYNGQPIDYRSVSELPQWKGRYDEIEFLLLSMLGDGGWNYEDEVYSRDYATNFVFVRMEFWKMNYLVLFSIPTMAELLPCSLTVCSILPLRG